MKQFTQFTTSPDHPWKLPINSRRGTIYHKLDHSLLADLHHRRITTRDLAKRLGVSESYLSSIFPGKVDSKTHAETHKRVLIAARRTYRLEIAAKVVTKALSLEQAAEMVRVCERTMLRAIADVKKAGKK